MKNIFCEFKSNELKSETLCMITFQALIHIIENILSICCFMLSEMDKRKEINLIQFREIVTTFEF